MHHSDQKILVKSEWAKEAYIQPHQYKDIYERSLRDPEAFWAQKAERLTWTKKWKSVKKTSFVRPVSIRWYEDGELNACFNCVDRHANNDPDRVAFYWEPDHPQEKGLTISYGELLVNVSKTAHILKEMGVKKGDRVTVYLPMIPEAVYTLLACARIGAVHSVVFAGFSAESLASRIQDCDSHFLVTCDHGYRGGKIIPLKVNADRAAEKCPRLEKILVIKRTSKFNNQVSWNPKIDIWYHEALANASAHCPCEPMNAEDPLFILYTSGSTGKPKGVLHTTGGYLVYTSYTHETVFDYKPGEVYWCAADIGWVTGHSYMVYGPLINGATSVLFEGIPTWPGPSRLWEIVDKYQVNILYTAPTLLRTLMREGPTPVQSTSRRSLRILGSVGEPINPEAWLWYFHVAGDGRCPIVDTWWQTETGGILITPLPGATDLKPGSASMPFFGIQPVVLDDQGNELKGACEGNLCLRDSWPGQMRTVYNNHERFEETYFSQFPGYYFAGDGCHRDEEGYYWIIGRVDDVINVSGHRMGTAEIESSLVGQGQVAEAAVVGYPHAIKGQGIYAFVTLMAGVPPSEELRQKLIKWVHDDIGGIARPDHIQFSPALPKTRSGKIMRRLLRKIAGGEESGLGDISTLADTSVIEDIMKEHRRMFGESHIS
ncbi:MAG: acetate--CoA ligase [Bdellovibrionales bacterium]|nr:acetate--CoA ligase [Bdellovibrionales bacterium]